MPSTGSQTGGGRTCLQYEPAHVALRGVIRRVTFPGPPNYESVARGDAAETCWLLELDRVACMDATPNDEINAAQSNIRRVQLVLDGEHDYSQYRQLVGEHVEAMGYLFAGHTGHHHTEVLLTVRELRPLVK